MDAQFPFLLEWLDEHPFRVSLLAGPGPFSAIYQRPDDLSASDDSAAYSTFHDVQETGDARSEAGLRQEVWFSIERADSLDIHEWFLRYVTPIGELLALATGRANPPTRLVTHLSTRDEASGQRLPSSVPVEVVFPERQPMRSPKPLDRSELLFNGVEVQADNLIPRWVKLAQDLDSVFELYFPVSHTESIYVEHQFMSVVQALETYHRRRHSNEVLPIEEFEKRIREIVECVPAAHRRWLKEKLQWANEPNLARRLRELLSESGGALRPLVSDEKKFVRRLTDTRNYRTHFDPRLAARAATGAELFCLTEACSMLVAACLLRELHIPANRWQEMFAPYRPFRDAVAHKASVVGVGGW